jgi:hypothetical protein
MAAYKGKVLLHARLFSYDWRIVTVRDAVKNLRGWLLLAENRQKYSIL